MGAKHCIASIVIFLVFIIPAFGQKSLTENQKINPLALTQDFYGQLVDLKGDVAVVTYSGAFRLVGGAFIYRHDGTSWQQDAFLSGIGPNGFIYAAIQDDWMFLGSGNATTFFGPNSGAVEMFQYDGNSWVSQGLLTPFDFGGPTLVENSGYGVSPRFDGNWAAIGSPLDDSVWPGNVCDSGTVYLYQWALDRWDFVAPIKLVPPGLGCNDFFGAFVDLKNNVLVVGANDLGTNATKGAEEVYVYEFDGIGWNLTATLTAFDAFYGQEYGHGVATNGEVILVGAVMDLTDPNTNGGSVYVYRKNGVSWDFETKITAPNPQQADLFGQLVTMDGDRALIGAQRASGPGKSFIFRDQGGSWVRELDFKASDENINYGYSLGSAGDMDGSRVILGAPWDQQNATSAGAIYAYDVDIIVQSVAPNAGPAGTVVVITGSGFTPDAQVRFGNRLATSVTYVDSSTLIATAPRLGPTGGGGFPFAARMRNVFQLGPVDVTVSNSCFSGTLAGAFRYTP